MSGSERVSCSKSSLSYRENFLRAIEFKNPEYIPCRVAISWPLWNTYREKLERIVARRKPLPQTQYDTVLNKMKR